MRILSIPFVVLPLLCLAQAPVRIIDPTALDPTRDLRRDRQAMAGLQASGLTGDEQDLVADQSSTSIWPTGLLNDSARSVNAARIKDYSAFRLGNFLRDTVRMAVVMIPAASNLHMPDELRPIADLFLALPEKAISNANTGTPRPRISRGPRWKSLREARIIKPDELFATYELAADSAAKTAMLRTMSESEYDQVVFRSNETNWPDGMNTFDERFPRIQEFKKYKAYASARWEDKILLIVPAEKNKKMGALLRPYVDLYFIYSKSAIEVKEKKK
ncbi:MAG: hypothetical protein WAU70_18055 [Flavobacteriales bacterium]